jgi:hypothetical protein
MAVTGCYPQLRSIKDNAGCRRANEPIRKLDDLQVRLRAD